MPYADFPWFMDVPAGKVLNVTEPTSGHFFWPDLEWIWALRQLNFRSGFRWFPEHRINSVQLA